MNKKCFVRNCGKKEAIGSKLLVVCRYVQIQIEQPEKPIHSFDLGPVDCDVFKPCDCLPFGFRFIKIEEENKIKFKLRSRS